MEEHIAKECRKLEEFREYPGVYDDAMREDITKRIDDLNEDLKVRQESISLLRGRLKNQITSFKETIAKVLDSNTSLAEKIRTLFREQGITIASILTVIGNGHQGTWHYYQVLPWNGEVVSLHLKMRPV